MKAVNPKMKEKIKEFKKIQEKKTIRYGIIVATYQRKDGTTPVRLKEALDSIQAQTYRNFRVYLMGDSYDNVEEIKNVYESVTDSDIVFENLEIPGERFRFTGKDLWHSGSNFAANIAIEKAINDGMTHIARLDHDDVWMPNHLSYLTKGYTMFPKAKFVSTTAIIRRFVRGEEFGSNYLRPMPEKIKYLGYNNLKHLTESWHSTISWDLERFTDLRYRNVREQKLTIPVRSECRGGDRDLIDRIKMQCKESGDKWVSLPLVTLLYRNKMGDLPQIDEEVEIML